MNTLWFVLKLFAVVVVGYLIGCFNFSVLIARAKGVDIRRQGSGNPGTMNMLRTFGIRWGVLTLVLDALKGAIPAVGAYCFLRYVAPEVNVGFAASFAAPAWLGYYIPGFGKAAMLIGGCAAIVGHVFPVFNRFKGGKGVATTIGVLLALDPIVTFACFLIGVLYLLFFKYGCVASFLVVIPSSICEAVFGFVWHDNLCVPVLALLIVALILVMHRENLKRLANGTESDANLLSRLRAHKNAARAADGAPDGTAETAAPRETDGAETAAPQDPDGKNE